MKRLKLETKMARVGDVIGENHSFKGKQFLDKHQIWIPENDKMLLSKEGPITFNQFKRKLKDLHPNFVLAWNPGESTPEAPMGHPIRFLADKKEWEMGYEPIDGVGFSNKTVIPANSQFVHYFNKDKNIYETRFVAKGWVQAYNVCMYYLVKKGLAKLQ